MAILFFIAGYAQAVPLRIIHISDFQSRFENAPRLARIIQDAKASAPGATLVVDAGDFIAGSLIQHLMHRDAFELRFMAELGIDVTTLGNHEFDFGLDAVAQMVALGRERAQKPLIVQTNLDFAADWQRYADHRILYLNRNGLDMAVFGIIGQHAVAVSPQLNSVKRYDPVEQISRLIAEEAKHIDLNIVLSHSGFYGAGLEIQGEDIRLAKEGKGIDVIISGHTHRTYFEPVVIGETILVQAGANGTHIGILDIEVQNERVELKNYQLIPADDSPALDAGLTQTLNESRAAVDEKILKPYHVTSEQVLFTLQEPWNHEQVGRSIAETLHKVLEERYEMKIDTVAVANGLVRESLPAGPVSVRQFFEVYPLGGQDGGDVIGYPLMSVYLDEDSYWGLMEIAATIGDLFYTNYAIYFSRLAIKAHRYRLPFNRVFDFSDREGAAPLRHVVINRYLWDMVPLVAEKTKGLITFAPKDASGNPVLEPERQYIAPVVGRKGYLSAWPLLLEYLHRGGEWQRAPERPQIEYEDSLLTAGYFQAWNRVTLTVLAVLVLLLGGMVWLTRKSLRRWRR